MKSFKDFVQELEKHFGEVTHLRITYPDGTIGKWRKIDGKFYAYKTQSSGPGPTIGKIKSTRSIYSRDQREED